MLLSSLLHWVAKRLRGARMRTKQGAHNTKLNQRLEAASFLLILHFFDITDEQIRHQVSPHLQRNASVVRAIFLNNNLVGDRGLAALYIPIALTSLNLSYNLGISDVGITALAPKLGNLAHLSLNGIIKVTTTGWRELAKHCVNLKVLELRRCALQDDSILALFSAESQMLQLRQLHLAGNFITDEGVQHLSRQAERNLRFLEVLSLESNRISDFSTSDAILGELMRVSRMHELGLSRNTRITDLGALDLARQLKTGGICLRTLKFDGFTLSNEAYKEVDRITALTRSKEFALVLNLLAKYSRPAGCEKPSPLPQDLVRLFAHMLL